MEEETAIADIPFSAESAEYSTTLETENVLKFSLLRNDQIKTELVQYEENREETCSDINANTLVKDEDDLSASVGHQQKGRKPRTLLTFEQRRVCQICHKVFSHPSNRLAHEKVPSSNYCWWSIKLLGFNCFGKPQNHYNSNKFC